MSDRNIDVWVGPKIIYLYGTVNGTAETFTLIGDGYWQATVPRTSDDNYELHLEAYSANGLEGAYDYTLYYGMMPSVINRTPSDVAYYKKQFAKINGAGWDSLTDAEKTEWLGANLRGGYWYTDLNRVGHNVEYLAGVLGLYGYDVRVTPVTDWTAANTFTAKDAATYLGNIAALKATFYGTTELPAMMANLTAEAANSIEKLLLEIEKHINWMIAGLRYSGTFQSGQGVILP